MFLEQWVDLQCFVDGDLWREESIIASWIRAVEVYTQVPWPATAGTHAVTWLVDPDREYEDPNGSNNALQYSFAVADTQEDFDFSLSASPNWQTVRMAESVSYQVNIYMNRARTESIHFSLDGVPRGMVYSFSPQSTNQSQVSRLSVTCNQPLSGVHYLRINASGHTRTRWLTIVLFVVPQPRGDSHISISAVPSWIALGENVSISGVVSPEHATIVSFRYTRPEGLTFMKPLRSESDGTFSYTFRPDVPGNWTFSVTWPGDSDHLEASSESLTVVVKEPPPEGIEFLNRVEAAVMQVIDAVALFMVIILILTILAALIVVGI
jgi:hypothetical protein